MLTHKGTKTLKTPRLTLRQFSIEDARAMYDNWASDEEVVRYLTWPAHGCVEISQLVLEDWVEAYSRPDYYQWAIVLDGLAEPIGSISAVKINEKAESAHIGYCIGRSWWNRGVTREALGAVIDFMFAEVGMRRVDSRHDPRNGASGAVMRACGMTYEGTLRQSDVNNQGWCDADWYSILRSEWEIMRSAK